MKAVMRKQSIIRESTCLIIFIGFFATIYGCDEEPEAKEDLSLPEVMSTIPQMGGSQASYANVIFTLNKPLAEAQVKGAAGTTLIRDKVVIFIPSPALPEGAVILTLTGVDESGQEMEEYTLKFTACVHKHPVEIDGYGCIPKDGEANVDPNDYPEKLTIAFIEPLRHAKVVAVDPEFPYTAKLGEDGMSLEISFVEYTMPYETKFTIELSVQDLAGNEDKPVYSFTTMIKE